MGKHSDPNPSWRDSALTIVRDIAAIGRTPSGRYAQEPTTATGVMKAVRRRPMVAAIALPAAATTAIVASSFAFAPTERDGVVRAEDSTASASQHVEESAAPLTEEQLAEHRAAAAEEYRRAIQEDPQYEATSGEAKAALPEPEPTPQDTESSEQSGSGTGSESDAGDSSRGEGSSSRSSARGVSGEPCSVSSSIESGLTPNAIKGYRAVCAAFPEVSSYGGVRSQPGSDHHTGQAVDVMITGSTGDRITEFLIANRSELNIKYVIWEQKIFASYTGWKGRGMEDRGSVTANHYDHVHISFN